MGGEVSALPLLRAALQEPGVQRPEASDDQRPPLQLRLPQEPGEREDQQNQEAAELAAVAAIVGSHQ